MKHELVNQYEFSQDELEDIEKMVEELGIHPDELSGQILDIGAGDGLLVRYLRSVNPEITCIGIDEDGEKESEDVLIADAVNMPFEDDSFDTILAFASVPNVFVMMYPDEDSNVHYEGQVKRKIESLFKEVLRVLREGKEAYFAPIFLENDGLRNKDMLVSETKEVLEDLQSSGLLTYAFEHTSDYHEPEEYGGRVMEVYRLVVKKGDGSKS
jgi:SAM-dependent methyltransferase